MKQMRNTREEAETGNVKRNRQFSDTLDDTLTNNSNIRLAYVLYRDCPVIKPGYSTTIIGVVKKILVMTKYLETNDHSYFKQRTVKCC